jgi:hypothetical protein
MVHSYSPIVAPILTGTLQLLQLQLLALGNFQALARPLAQALPYFKSFTTGLRSLRLGVALSPQVVCLEIHDGLLD